MNIRMEDACLERGFRRREWVVVRDLQGHPELATFVRGVCWSVQDTVPKEHVVIVRLQEHSLGLIP